MSTANEPRTELLAGCGVVTEMRERLRKPSKDAHFNSLSPSRTTQRHAFGGSDVAMTMQSTGAQFRCRCCWWMKNEECSHNSNIGKIFGRGPRSFFPGRELSDREGARREVPAEKPPGISAVASISTWTFFLGSSLLLVPTTPYRRLPSDLVLHPIFDIHHRLY